MKYKPVRDRCCQNENCQDHGKFGKGNIIRHSMYKTRQGRRRRYLCKNCEKTFSSTKGTPYYRLHKSRSDFDEVVQMTVEGVGISSISRIKHLAWKLMRFEPLLAQRRSLYGFSLQSKSGQGCGFPRLWATAIIEISRHF